MPDPFDGRSEITAEEYQAFILGAESIPPPEPIIPAWQTSEKAFLAKVDAYAKDHGFLTYHTWKSANSAPGFPDLVMIRDGRMVVAELKVGTNRTTKDQERWLAAFRSLDGRDVWVYIWRPEHWDEIEEVLT